MTALATDSEALDALAALAHRASRLLPGMDPGTLIGNADSDEELFDRHSVPTRNSPAVGDEVLDRLSEGLIRIRSAAVN